MNGQKQDDIPSEGNVRLHDLWHLKTNCARNSMDQVIPFIDPQQFSSHSNIFSRM